MSRRMRASLPFLILAVGFLISAVLYLTLITTNCDSRGLVGLAEDVRAFHTDRGC